MATHLEFTSKEGAKVTGALSLPPGEGKAPGLVLIQEWWGVNDHIKSLADRFAVAGFVVLAPDLYHGTITRDAAEAARLMNELDGARAMADITAAVHELLAHPRVNGKVGVTGFCMGGAYTYVAATRIPEVSAGVSFYGIPPAGRADYAHAKPMMAHVASRDEWVTVAKAEAVKKEIESHGGKITLHVYEPDHAFVNDTRPEVYNPEAAKLAWDRSVAFLHEQLDTRSAS